MSINQIEKAIETLASSGQYNEAADLALKHKLYTRAGELYEKIWLYEEAADAFASNQDWTRALKSALQTKAPERVANYLRNFHSPAEKQQALDLLVQYKNFSIAASLAHELDQLELAQSLYEQTGHYLSAARIAQHRSDITQTERLAKAVLSLGGDVNEQGEALLILASTEIEKGHFHEASAYLQDVPSDSTFFPKAMEQLTRAFAKQGLLEAATQTFVRLRRVKRDVPKELDQFLANEAEEHISTPQEDRVLGRYLRKELLGAGSTANVYAGIDLITNTPCAIKVLSTLQDKKALMRFQKEVEITSNLRHPNIVAVLDVAPHRGIIVLERMYGNLNGRSPSPREIPILFSSILAGLAEAHLRGIVHRDVKPSNILFDKNGTPKLSDFGAAHLTNLGHTQTGGLIGTMAYMSPEQVTGAPITVASDLYSIGVCLFEHVCGSLPFPGPDFMAQHLSFPIPRPSEHGAHFAWDELIMACLAKNPQDRPTSCQAVIDKLEQIRSALPESDSSVRDKDGHSSNKNSTSLNSSAAPTLVGAAAGGGPPNVMGAKHESGPRYIHQTLIDENERYTLTRCHDTYAKRTVLIQKLRVAPSESQRKHIDGLARLKTPYVQTLYDVSEDYQRLTWSLPNGVSTPPALPSTTVQKMEQVLAEPLEKTIWLQPFDTSQWFIHKGTPTLSLIEHALLDESHVSPQVYVEQLVTWRESQQ